MELKLAEYKIKGNIEWYKSVEDDILLTVDGRGVTYRESAAIYHKGIIYFFWHYPENIDDTVNLINHEFMHGVLDDGDIPNCRYHNVDDKIESWIEN